MEPTATPFPTPSPTMLPDPTQLPDLTQVATQLQVIADNQVYQHSLIITFANIFFGLLLGYFAARGLTDPWR